MRITVIGAAQEVTGSSFLVEAGGGRYLVDCGMFQGGADAEARNRTFAFKPAEIDAVFLTHAHLDHCGRLPLLSRQGFRGEIYTTPASREIAHFILLDSAKVQEEDYLRHQRKAMRAGKKILPPLYLEQDVIFTMSQFRVHPYETPLRLRNDAQVIFHQSGHVLGSAFIEFRAGGKAVLFSGDMGGNARNVVPDPSPPPHCALVFCESTYGDRVHRTYQASVSELRDAVLWAGRQGGNVVIPTFALERAQDLLFCLRELRENNELPRTPAYLDSPLSINITEVYSRHARELDEETRAVLARGEDPFHFPGLVSCTAVEQSRAINARSGVIIIAGSGMCQGGRVVHHLRHNLWRPDSAVIFVGYQAEGTLGRRIVSGARTVRVYGEPVAVKARIFTINGFSAHADRDELLAWLRASGGARIVLNHGEEGSSAEMARALRAQRRDASVAHPNQVYEV